ncbi:ribonuclease J, partial [bacterium]|nr:ribonuclease J [bacterium]
MKVMKDSTDSLLSDTPNTRPVSPTRSASKAKREQTSARIAARRAGRGGKKTRPPYRGKKNKPQPKKAQHPQATKTKKYPQAKKAAPHKRNATKTRAGKTGSHKEFTIKDSGKSTRPISKLEANKLRIVPIGGCEEVGRNMTVFEYGNDIVIVDMGLQWPEEDMPGIDYIIPNIDYLKGKEKNIRGVVITHGHYDHIGAVPHLAPRLGNPTIYGTPLTLGIIAKRQEDYKGNAPLRLKSITVDNKLTLGKFKISFF